MAYIDDWGGTAADRIAELQSFCSDATCAHMKYLHGDAREVRVQYNRHVEYTAGPCTQCKCSVFWAEPPITRDDVLDLAVALRYDVRLEDVGIAPIGKAKCAQLTIRHTGAGEFTAACSLESNHPGDHEPDWSDLHSAT